MPIGLTFALSIALYDWQPRDWTTATAAGSLLVHGDLGVYADMPQAQMGPLALLFSGVLPRPAYILLASAAVGLALRFADRYVRPVEFRERVAFASGGAIVALPWTINALSGHMDEVIVLVAMCGAAVAVKENRATLTAALVVLAVAGKPTGLLFLPLAFMQGRRAGVVASVGAVGVYLPFFLADPSGLLGAGGGWNHVGHGSLLHLVGFEWGTPYPVWIRPAQLVGGWALIWFMRERWGLALVLVTAWAWKACLEPSPPSAYATPIIVAALLISPARRGAVVAALALVAWVIPWEVPVSPQNGVIRLVFLAAGPLTATTWIRRSAGTRSPVARRTSPTRRRSGSPPCTEAAAEPVPPSPGCR